jgi:hypothetical protein
MDIPEGDLDLLAVAETLIDFPGRFAKRLAGSSQISLHHG